MTRHWPACEESIVPQRLCLLCTISRLALTFAAACVTASSCKFTALLTNIGEYKKEQRGIQDPEGGYRLAESWFFRLVSSFFLLCQYFLSLVSVLSVWGEGVGRNANKRASRQNLYVKSWTLTRATTSAIRLCARIASKRRQ